MGLASAIASASSVAVAVAVCRRRWRGGGRSAPFLELPHMFEQRDVSSKRRVEDMLESKGLLAECFYSTQDLVQAERFAR